MVVADELLFVFGFIFASIVCEDGIDYRPPWQYGLASQNSACQQVNLKDRTRNDKEFYELDFISHPEEFNGENDLGC